MSWWVDGERARKPVANSARARAWEAMRRFEQRREAFSVADLRLAIQEIPAPLRRGGGVNISTYVADLARAGYLRLVSGGRENLWRLTRDSGPLPPICLRAGGIYDPNTRGFLPAPAAADGAEART